LLGEMLTVAQLFGGLLILAGIVCVRSEKTNVPVEPASVLLPATIDRTVA
jgi:drug/metabolite transporter (DMT)-like permease